MSQRPLQLDRVNNAYFLITLAREGPVYSTPSALADLHPALTYVGRVGELEDTHIYSSPLQEGDVVAEFLKEKRNGEEGIIHVDFPEEITLTKRSKKNQDEL